MSRLLISRIKLFAILVFLSTLVGIADTDLSQAVSEDDTIRALTINGVHWLAGSSLTWAFEIFLVPSRVGAGIRRLHFLTAIFIKSAIMVLIVAFVFLLGQIIMAGSPSLAIFADSLFYRVLGLVFIVIIVLQTATQIIRIIGGRTLINFVLGKYHRPVREETIFMFLDLVGSTSLAERLGDVGVQTMITTFFFDITEPIIEHGGDIHRYVGDQVVVTWPLRAGADNLRAIQCCFAISELVRNKAQEYEQKFGVVPAFRIGLHGGPVVISQCGDQKQEISYFGDTVNTAARIEQQCKVLNCPLLISADLLDRITLYPEFRAQPKGSVQLRGRKQETKLFTILFVDEAAWAASTSMCVSTSTTLPTKR